MSYETSSYPNPQPHDYTITDNSNTLVLDQVHQEDNSSNYNNDEIVPKLMNPDSILNILEIDATLCSKKYSKGI